MKMDPSCFILCLILMMIVSTAAVPVRNDGPYFNSDTKNSLHQKYTPFPIYMNQMNIPPSSSSSNNNIPSLGNNVDQTNIYVQQEQETNSPLYSFPQPKRKHYKIILVRPPTQLIQPPVPQPEIEEQTIVYVLVKKSDEPKIDIEPSQPTFKTSKPEVYFVNYQTKNKQNDLSKSQFSTKITPIITPPEESKLHYSSNLP